MDDDRMELIHSSDTDRIRRKQEVVVNQLDFKETKKCILRKIE
jgi:hypothetical protein